MKRILHGLLLLALASCAPSREPEVVQHDSSALSSLFTSSSTPASSVGGSVSNELGVKFQTTEDGEVTHFRFYRRSGDGGSHTGHLWLSGSIISTAEFKSMSSSGWQDVLLATPVNIRAFTDYIVSYSSTSGFAYTDSFYTGAQTVGQLKTATGAGMYASGGAGTVPNTVYLSNASFFADVVFASKSDSQGEWQTYALSSPYSTSGTLGTKYVWSSKLRVPSDVTSLEIGLANRDNLSGPLGTVTGVEAAGGKPGSNGSWATSYDQRFQNVTIPSGGTWWSGLFSPTLDTDGGYLVAWSIPTGQVVGLDSGSGAFQQNGYYSTSTDVSTLASMTAVGSSNPLGLEVLVRYKTKRPKLTVLSDSIQRSMNATNGLLDGLPQLTTQYDWGVACNGVASSRAAYWADHATKWWLISDNYSLYGNIVLIHLGFNDVANNLTLPNIMGYLDDLVRYARASGALRVGVGTITPYSGLTSGQNDVRNAANTNIRNGALHADFVADFDLRLRDAMSPNQLASAYGGAGVVHPNAAGMAECASETYSRASASF